MVSIAAPAGLGTLASITALSIAVTLARRHRAQRVLRRRIVARLEAIGRGGETPPDVQTSPRATAVMATAPADTLEARLLRPKPPV